jgi:uncharacterized protein (DUF58 family)
MPDSKRFLRPEVIKRIARMELRARHVVEGYLAGMHRSPYFGQSVEFRQHREYVAGDDLRHVDWKVWARQDRLYVKQYDEDTNLRCVILLDASASMQYGRGALSKWEYACTAAACLAYLILRQQDAVGVVVFDDQLRTQVPLRSRRVHLQAIVDTFHVERPREKTNLQPVFQSVAELFPRRGMMIVVSDLLADVATTLRGLRLLRQRGHDVLVLHVLDDDELDFPFAGPTRFEGLETSDFLNCNPRALRQGYLEALQGYLEELRRGCAQQMVDYTLLRTSDALDAALSAFLSHRLGMHHRNIP